MRGRSWVAWWKTRRTLRVPAGDPPEGEDDCECGNYLLTEDSDPIQTELTSYLSPEA